LPKATELKRGMVVVMDGELWNVVEATHVTPGNWRGMVQVVMKGLKAGSKKLHRFSSTEVVETAFLDKKKMQYSYKDSAGYCFMDVETYEQTILTDDEVGEAKFYLKENEEVVVTFHDGVPIGLELPSSVVLVITETTPGTKGRRSRSTRARASSRGARTAKGSASYRFLGSSESAFAASDHSPFRPSRARFSAARNSGAWRTFGG